MKKVVLTFGLIAGAILSASMIIALPFREQIGLDRGMIVGYTTMVLAFLMVYFGVRQYRDTVAGGSIAFGRAFLVSMAIVGVATVCYVATWEIIYFFVTPDFSDAYAAHAVEKLRQAGAPAAQIAAKVKEMEEFKVMYRNPLYNIAFTTLEPLPVGLLASLLSSWMLSRNCGAAAVATA
ncbi:MAG TPA: DUF4199 domain-containing protein [Gemmatimonadaceae bacterium]|nr:DUF4199 domain-containing protein [Gemmatimonadaceae bacterium]